MYILLIATDSNSNGTGGSPSSITSGTSPIHSPTLNCSSNTATHNHSSDSTSVDYTEKRNKSENSSIKILVRVFALFYPSKY